MFRYFKIVKQDNLRLRGGVWFQCGPQQVHISVQQDLLPALKAHPAFRVTQLQELRYHLMQSGVNVTDDEAQAEDGVRRIYVHDPFANRLELLETL